LENSLVNSVLLQTFALLTAVQRANKAPHRPLHQHLSRKSQKLITSKNGFSNGMQCLKQFAIKPRIGVLRGKHFLQFILFIDIFACCAMCKQSSEPPAPPAPMQKSQKLLASNASAKAAS
jgi:hypothetical protein